MQDNHRVKLKRVLGFAPAYGAAVGLVVSGTAMFSVGNVAGTSGYATFITAIIALIPMMAAAFAFGELTAMLPGGGMISDYTQPALGKFFSTFALLSGYLVLISTDGAMQLVMGGVSLESLCGVPQIAVTAVMFLIVMVINMVNVDFYGKIESVVTIAMMIVFAAFAVLCLRSVWSIRCSRWQLFATRICRCCASLLFRRLKLPAQCLASLVI